MRKHSMLCDFYEENKDRIKYNHPSKSKTIETANTLIENRDKDMMKLMKNDVVLDLSNASRKINHTGEVVAKM